MLIVVPVVDIGRIGTHRRIQIDRDFRDFATPDQTRDLEHHTLNPADGKGGYEDRAAAFDDPVDDIGQFSLGVDFRMLAVAVC